jgi:hypothetical protein
MPQLFVENHSGEPVKDFFIIKWTLRSNSDHFEDEMKKFFIGITEKSD